MLKKFDKFVESSEEFDLKSAVAEVMAEFSEEQVVERYDEELLEWVDEDWQDDYESEYEWYIDHNNGEAQDVVIKELTNWYKSKHPNTSLDDICDLTDELLSEYGI